MAVLTNVITALVTLLIAIAVLLVLIKIGVFIEKLAAGIRSGKDPRD